MDFKNKVKSYELNSLYDAIFKSAPVNEISELEGCDLVDGNSTPYSNSSDEDESFEEGPDGETIRKQDMFPRFDRKANVPKFVIGMKFSDKKEFKDAIIKYGLAERKVMKLVKDEGNRVRVVCDWPFFVTPQVGLHLALSLNEPKRHLFIYKHGTYVTY
jgi:alpha-galactosidase